MIPKIIHYGWFTKENSYPIQVKNCITGWKKHLPGWKLLEWNFNNFDINISCFTKEASLYGQAAYPYISDYVRLWALYKYGGVWLDTDQVILEDLEEIVNNEKVFFGMINPGEIGCGIIGAEPRNLVIEQLLEQYEKMHYIISGKPHPKNSVYVFTETLKKYYEFDSDVSKKQELSRFTIYPKDVFYPENYSKVTPSSLSIHLGMTSHYKKVSVVMPVRNGEKYIKQSIDSVLSQTLQDFELIVVDDGSNDNTGEIVKSIKSDKIVYLKQDKLGISAALNKGIRNSIGLMIARMDSDDIMLPNRLEIQYNYLSKHQEIDILGTGFIWGNNKTDTEYFNPKEGKITKDNLLSFGNLLAHPTVMFRRDKVKEKLGEYPYEGYYNGAEDYKLWIKAIDSGLKIYNIPEPTLIYRQHTEQQDSSKKDLIAERIRKSYTRKNNKNTELTCIIPFKNEGDEVEKTVASIRATSCCNIILINDCSTDKISYSDVANQWGCDYVESKKPLGVAGGRNLGVELCETEYFVLLDAHMRFYDDNWDERVIYHLKKHPESILTSNSSIFTKEPESDYINEDSSETNKQHSSLAAKINMTEPGWEYTAKWTGKGNIINYEDNLTQCSCVLGAFYASNKTWWNKIGGLNGLVGWGGDEPLCSIKTYLAGGECLLLKDFFVGHLYRGKAPYATLNSSIDSNQIYLIELFTADEKLKELYLKNLENRIGKEKYKSARESFFSRYEEFLKFKNLFYSEIAKVDWKDWIKLNNRYE